MAGSKTLEDLRGRVDRVGLACTRCDRRESVAVETLAEAYGWKRALPDVRHWLARDCPRRQASAYVRCDPEFRRAGT